jgi:TolA-binding protein
LEAILSSAEQAVPDDATPFFRVAQEAEGNQPTAAEAHWKLGLALQQQGQTAKAVEEWKTAVRLDPQSPASRELKRRPGAISADLAPEI